jgi:hypothetical protein
LHGNFDGFKKEMWNGYSYTKIRQAMNLRSVSISLRLKYTTRSSKVIFFVDLMYSFFPQLEYLMVYVVELDGYGHNTQPLSLEQDVKEFKERVQLVNLETYERRMRERKVERLKRWDSSVGGWGGMDRRSGLECKKGRKFSDGLRGAICRQLSFE